jgi:hypothetical protein
MFTAGFWKRKGSIVSSTGASVRTQFTNPVGPQLPEVEMDDSIYRHHEGYLFTPGAENYVFEWPFEFPVMSPWGGGGGAQGQYVDGIPFTSLQHATMGHFMGNPVNDAFNPLQPPQVFSNPTTVTNGLGGLQAGGLASYPLLDDGQ